MEAAKVLVSQWICTGSPELLLHGDPISTKILRAGPYNLHLEIKNQGSNQVNATAFISVPPGKETTKKFYKFLQNS